MQNDLTMIDLEKKRRAIGLSRESLDMLFDVHKSMNKHLKKRTRKNLTSLSKIFEYGIKAFYNLSPKKIPIKEGATIKRQTVYLTFKTSAKFNELLVKSDYESFSRLAHVILKRIYFPKKKRERGKI